MSILNKIYLCLMLCSGMQHTFALNNDKEILDFFEHFQTEYNQFSENYVRFYADNMSLKMHEIQAENQVVLNINHDEFLNNIHEILALRKVHYAFEKFSNIKIIPINEQTYKITADRYIYSKCFLDTKFNMTIQKDQQKIYKIIEQNEYYDKAVECTQTIQKSFPYQLDMTAFALALHVPYQLQQGVVLERINTENNAINLFVFVDRYSFSEIEKANIHMQIETAVKDKFCHQTYARDFFDAGMVFNQLLFSRNNELLSQVRIDKQSCHLE
ncbi:hypothetical protein [Acinetobacter sp. Marseille-Q1618]|uniref:hypothetical protein n=1 Tax=Acinetobacter sp. Marseille-Q1618 TaxID=2697502 RepID=UPI0015705890|nr:hypothetical protein [Acinetobacter sp. Marseille-Q1618]